jgi:hypothetical protein
MPTPSATIEIPTGPIRGYFAPWTATTAKIQVEPAMARRYERLWQKRRRANNISRFGLSMPMIDLFGKLFTSFAMFSAICAIILATSYVFQHSPIAAQKPFLLEILRAQVFILFTVNVSLLIWSITKGLIKTVKEI